MGFVTKFFIFRVGFKRIRVHIASQIVRVQVLHLRLCQGKCCTKWNIFIFRVGFKRIRVHIASQIVRVQVLHLRLCQGKCCTIPLGLALRCTQPIIFYSRIAFLIITSSIINLRFEFISRYQSLVQRPICAVGKASPFVWNHISHLHTFRDELRYRIYYYLNCICCIDYRYIAADVSRVWRVLFDLNMNQDKCWLQTLIWSDISDVKSYFHFKYPFHYIMCRSYYEYIHVVGCKYI